MKFEFLNENIVFLDNITTNYIFIGQTVIDTYLDHMPNTINILTKSSPNIFIDYLQNENILYKYDNFLSFLYKNKKYKIYFTKTSYCDFLSKQITTMNAMGLDKELNIIDYYNALGDIKNKRIRLIDNNSIYEDNKLMLKLIRYSSEYGFLLDESLFDIINEHSPNIILVNNHTIKDELVKIVMSDNPHYIKHLEEYGLLKYILPELHLCFHTPHENPYHIYNIGDHTVEVLKNLPKDYDLRMTALFHDIGKCFCKRLDNEGIAHYVGHNKISKEKASIIFERLFFSIKETRTVLKLIDLHNQKVPLKLKNLRRFIVLNNISDEFFNKLLAFQYADALGKNPECLKTEVTYIEEIKKLYERYKKDSITVNDLNITVKDLISNGINKRKVKPILEALLEFVLENPDSNKKEILIEKAKKLERKIRI